MTEAESIKFMLNDSVSLAIVNGDKVATYNERGIKSLLCLVREDRDLLCGATVADKIVGKAAALLLINGGVESVYAGVISHAATTALRAHGIKYSYGTLVERIINRAGTDVCPMEKAVASCTNPNDVVDVLTEALNKLGKR